MTAVTEKPNGTDIRKNDLIARVAMWFVGLGLAGLVGYFASSSTMNARMTAVETKIDLKTPEIERRLQSIENKIDGFIQRQSSRREDGR